MKYDLWRRSYKNIQFATYGRNIIVIIITQLIGDIFQFPKIHNFTNI